MTGQNTSVNEIEKGKILKKTSDSKLTSQKYDIHANKENFAPIITQPLRRSTYRQPY